MRRKSLIALTALFGLGITACGSNTPEYDQETSETFKETTSPTTAPATTAAPATVEVSPELEETSDTAPAHDYSPEKENIVRVDDETIETIEANTDFELDESFSGENPDDEMGPGVGLEPGSDDAVVTPTKNSGTADAPSGSGIISEEEVQKGYVWMNKIAKDIFHMTYEELAEHFGVDGEFVKEEYSDHMGYNKRYYKWTSADDNTHYIYVNFDEKNSDGVYTISSYNSSGFSSTDAEAQYLEELEAEAQEADKAAAANMAMKDFSVDVYPSGEHEDHLTFSMQMPESGWAYDDKKNHLVENEDVGTFGAGFIQFKVDDKVEDFDFYKDKFEDYEDIGTRDIGGVTMQGRKYKNIGYDWTEYIAQVDDSHAVSIGVVDVDISEGTTGDRIINSIQIK